MRLTTIHIAPVLLATAALTACGEKQLETAKNEAFIRGVVVKQIGVRVKSVRCPDGLTAKTGATFTCGVTGTDGSTGTVAVRQANDKGTIAVTAPFLHMREVEESMAGPLGRQVKATVSVTCQEIVVVKRSALFTCKVRYKGRTRNVSARMTDDTGRFRYRLAKQRA